MLGRHPIIVAVVGALVVLGVAIVIGVATGDDTSDSAATTDAADSGGYLSDGLSSHGLLSAGADSFVLGFESPSGADISVTKGSQSCFDLVPEVVVLTKEAPRAEVTVTPWVKCNRGRLDDQSWNFWDTHGPRLGDVGISYAWNTHRVYEWHCRGGRCDVEERRQTFLLRLG